MSNAVAEPWFGGGVPFAGREPPFYDAAAFPWVREIEANWTVIREELLGLVQDHRASLVPYANHAMATTATNWKSFLFLYWTLKARRNCKKCPRTWEILSRTPNITSCGFSLLEPNTTIKPHQGDTNAVYRCHLGLVIPAPAPQCAFRVANETRSWQEGRMMVFCDAHTHTAWNNTNQLRCVLLMDVMRPEYVSQRFAVSSRVLARIYLDVACQRAPVVRWLFGGSRRRRALEWTLRNTLRGLLYCRVPMPPLFGLF
jgi:aspartyl/asparaginyl beta-hydroxylase (cupin superfamily)